MSTYYVTKEYGNGLYLRLLEDGFARFRTLLEVSWYATLENNTPYEEEWKIEGIYFVPVKSQVMKKGA